MQQKLESGGLKVSNFNNHNHKLRSSIKENILEAYSSEGEASVTDEKSKQESFDQSIDEHSTEKSKPKQVI